MCLGDKGRKIALLKEYKIKKARAEEMKKLAEDKAVEGTNDEDPK